MNYTLKDLLDIPRLRALLDSLDELHSMPSAIIDSDGVVLTATGGQDICTKFHRVNSDTEKMCIESDRHIESLLDEGTPHVIYRCPMGLVDTAMPVIIEGEHLGNVFTGQLFLDSPDEAYFINQARKYGFDEEKYLEAVRKVPFFEEDKLHKNLNFIHALTQMLAEQGLQNKRLLEADKHDKLRNTILEMLARDKSLAEILEAIVRAVEQDSPSMICSILLLDSEGRRLHLGVAPSLPDFYNSAIEGIEIGPGAGSCGTAAFTGERVIADDLATHPYWAAYRELTARAGLGSCWSEPIRSPTGKILGTFAIYRREAYLPSEADITMIKQSSSLASIAIEKKIAEEKFLASEELHRTIIKTAMEGIWLADTLGRIVEVNDCYCLMSGYNEQEMLTMSLHDMEATETTEDTAARIKMIIEQGEARFESRHRRKDGTVFDVEINVQYRPAGKGQLVAFVRDITERKQAEEKINSGLNLRQTLLDAIPSPVFYKDAECVYIGCNKAFVLYLGLPKEQIIGKSVYDIAPPDLAEKYDKADRELLNNPGTQVYEASVVYADGTRHDVIFNKATFDNADGAVAGLIGVILDITERKRSEESLSLAKDDWECTFESLTDMVTVHDENYNIIRANSSAREMLQSNLSVNFMDTKCFMAYHGMEKPPEGCPSCKSLETGQPCFFELFEPHLNKYLEVRAIPRFDNQRRCIGLVHIVRDITERKKAEEEHAKLESQLHQAQKVESIGRLAGGVAHDFNNMLSVILGHTEMSLMQIDAKHPMYLSLTEIHKAAERSSNLTRQLLAFARKQTVVPKVINLNETVAGMLSMLQRIIGENMNLAWKPGANIWPVFMDNSQLDQIMANLCVNARDAIADVGKIIIETEDCSIDENYCKTHPYASPGDYVKIVVSDNGTGMDKETLANIFEPFFTTKGVGEGTGLGLSTVYGIVRQNKGFFNVFSEPGRGTAFTIYLPRYEGKADISETKGATESFQRGNETILLVEDEPSILEMTTMILEDLGYSVLKASSPGEAIRLAREHRGEIHLLITDVIMPEMNGKELANTLLSIHPQIKCLFMSGYTADIISPHGVLEEGVHFIQKPFKLNALAAKLREVLES